MRRTTSIWCAAAALVAGACASDTPEAREARARDAFGRLARAGDDLSSALSADSQDDGVVTARAKAVGDAAADFAHAFAAASEDRWDRPEDAAVAARGFAVAGRKAQKTGDHRAAARAFERSLAANYDAALVAPLVRETALAGEFDEAAARARRYAATMKTTFVPVAWDALGDVEALRGDRDAAIAAYRRADQSNPHC